MLYKYAGWDCNLRDSLKNRYFWFSKPTNFNDPFDSNMDRLLSSSFGRENLKIEELKINTDKFGVLCFTKKTEQGQVGDKGYNNLHFWSHYADYHKGVSLGFAESEIQSYYSEVILCNAELNKVNYVDAPIDLDTYLFKFNDNEYNIQQIFSKQLRGDLKISDSFFEQFLLLKDARIWNLENEYRIILAGGALQNLKAPKLFKDTNIEIFDSSGKGYRIPYPNANVLKEVTFGVNFNKNKIKDAIQLISRSNKGVEFYKASLDFINSDVVRQEIK